MRRLHLLPVALAALSLLAIGCSSSSSGDDTAIVNGSGQVTNPGGKPASEADSARASQMQSQGQQMSAQAAKDAAAMKAAMAKSRGN